MRRILLCGVLLIACLAAAQQPAEILALVTDRRGEPVGELTSQDLRVMEKGRPVVFQVSSAADRPVEYGILLDVSRSTLERFREQKQLALEIVRTMDARGISGSMMVFAIDARPLAAANAQEAESRLRNLGMGGGTAVYDAVVEACTRATLFRSAGPGTRRFLFLVSDGEDNVSHATRHEAAQAAVRRGVMVVAFTPTGFDRPARGDETLREIATATGGLQFQVRLAAEVAPALRLLLDHQWALSWTAAEGPAGKPRKVKVGPAGSRDLRVFAPRTYFVGRAK